MADEVKIVFRTLAELKGAEELAANLEKQIGKAKALGKEYAQLDQKLNSVNAALAGPRQQRDEGAAQTKAKAAAAAEAALATKAAAKASDEYAQAGGRLGKILGTVSPQLGRMVGLLRAGAGFAAIASALFGAKKALDAFAGQESAGQAERSIALIASRTGDATQAAKIYKDALEGNVEALNKLGIEADELQAKSATQKTFEEAKAGGNQLFASIGGVISRTGILQTVFYGLGESAKFLAEALGGMVPSLEEAAPLVDALGRSGSTLAAEQKKFKEEITESNLRLKEQIGLIRQTGSAAVSKIRADERLNVAKIDNELAQGKITPEEAARQKANVRFASQGARSKAQEDAALGEINARQGNLGALQAGFQSRQARAQELRGSVDQLREFEAASVAFTAAVKELQAARAAVSGLGVLKGARTNLAYAESNVAELGRKRQALAAGLPEGIRTAEQAGRVAGEIEGALPEDRRTIEELRAEVNLLSRELESMREVNRTEADTTGLEGSTEMIRERERARKAATDEAKRGREKLNQTVEQLLEAGGNADARTVFLVQELLRQKREQDARLSKLETVVQNNTVR